MSATPNGFSSTLYKEYPWILFALCLWREARGCTLAEIEAIANVISNRAADPQKRFGKDLVSVITAKDQFTSISPPVNITRNEWVNATKWPGSEDAEFLACCAIADSFGQATNGADPTKGATNYYSVPIEDVPDWADPDKMTLSIGSFRFFKL